MATIKFVLDPRVKSDGTASVMLKFNHQYFRKKVNVGVSVNPENWDGMEVRVSTNQKYHRQINQRLENPERSDPVRQVLIDPLKLF